MVGSRFVFDVSEPSAYDVFLEEGGRRPDDGRALSVSARVAQTLNVPRPSTTDYYDDSRSISMCEWRQVRPDPRPPTTDYYGDNGDVSMYALAEVAPRLPTTDHRLLIESVYL